MLKLPPPIWAILYMLACAAVSWALGWPRFVGPAVAPLGMAVTTLGFVLPVWAFVLFRREGTELDPTSAANRKLVTTGPYRITRNPMYLGLVVIAAGVALWIGAWPMLVAPIAIFVTANWVHIPFEEAKMRRQFTAAFDDYTGRVRRWV